MAKVTIGQKQFEKQETIAVGRALAFAGYLSSGDIACQEEMDGVHHAAAPHDGVTVKNLVDLKINWEDKHSDLLSSMSEDEQKIARARWVKDKTGRDFDVSDFRQWTADDLRKCQEALGTGG